MHLVLDWYQKREFNRVTNKVSLRAIREWLYVHFRMNYCRLAGESSVTVHGTTKSKLRLPKIVDYQNNGVATKGRIKDKLDEV